MWYELPLATASLIAAGLNALADQCRAAFDRLCSTLPHNVAIEMVERARADCEQLAQAIEADRAAAHEGGQSSILHYLPEASVRLVLDGLAILDSYAEFSLVIAHIKETLQSSIARPAILLPDAASPLEQVAAEPTVRPS
jgi:hypothetical protein